MTRPTKEKIPKISIEEEEIDLTDTSILRWIPKTILIQIQTRLRQKMRILKCLGLESIDKSIEREEIETENVTKKQDIAMKAMKEYIEKIVKLIKEHRAGLQALIQARLEKEGKIQNQVGK